MSFNPEVGRWFARHAPERLRGLVVTESGQEAGAGVVERPLALWRARPDFLAYDIRDLPSRFADGAAGERHAGADLDGADARTSARAPPRMPTRSSTRARHDERASRSSRGWRRASRASRRRIGTAAPAPPIRSSATPSSPRSRNSGSATAATGWQPLPIAIDGADGRPGGGDAGLCEEPQPGRICVRSWLGRRL